MERKTVEAMIHLFCRNHHQRQPPCEECSKLMGYVDARLAACVFRERKPTCVKCPVHCYSQAMRQRIAEVMRYAGPRMMTRHPILAIRHVIRERLIKRTIPARRPQG
jgi:hypothetical protein